MRSRLLTVLGPCILALLAGCGSGGTRTVSVADSQTTQTPPATPSGASGATAGGGATGPASGVTSAGGTTSSPQGGPAFATPGAGSGGAGNAVSVLQARGFRALDPGEFHPAQTLRVLIGARQGSADGHVQQAFFFVGGRYIGTDTAEPSAQIRVVAQTDTSVTLSYGLYRPGDPLCCAGGGQANVTYQLDNGHLHPLNPIPSASAGATRSRL